MITLSMTALVDDNDQCINLNCMIDPMIQWLVTGMRNNNGKE